MIIMTMRKNAASIEIMKWCKNMKTIRINNITKNKKYEGNEHGDND